MSRFKMQASWAVLLTAACCAPNVGAVTIDFEDPPYTDGVDIAGQDSWVLNSYASAAHGTVVSSSTSPLADSQSLRYTRTDTNLSAFSAGDVSKPDVIIVPTDGTSAADLTAGFQIAATSRSADGNGFGQVGFFLSNDGFNGATPFGVALNNAGSNIPSIEVFRNGSGGAGFYFLGADQPSSAFPEGDTIEFDLGIDFDTQMFTVAATNASTGVPFSAPSGPFAFAVPFPANPDGTYSVDTLAFLRFGAGQIDNITLTAAIPEPATCVLALAGVAALVAVRRVRS